MTDISLDYEREHLKNDLFFQADQWGEEQQLIREERLPANN
jgi:hypothetical protein